MNEIGKPNQDRKLDKIKPRDKNCRRKPYGAGK